MDRHGGNIYVDNKIIYDFSVNLSPLGLPKGVKESFASGIESSDGDDSLFCSLRDIRTQMGGR